MSTIRQIGRRMDLTLERTEARVTPRPASERFRDTLGAVVVNGVEQAAGLVGGNSAVSLAVRQGGASAGPGTSPQGAPEGPGGSGTLSGASMLDSQTSNAMQLLELQQQISFEQQRFSTVSNVMKARHDTAKQVINNVR